MQSEYYSRGNITPVTMSLLALICRCLAIQSKILFFEAAQHGIESKQLTHLNIGRAKVPPYLCPFPFCLLGNFRSLQSIDRRDGAVVLK